MESRATVSPTAIPPRLAVPITLAMASEAAIQHFLDMILDELPKDQGPRLDELTEHRLRAAATRVVKAL